MNTGDDLSVKWLRSKRPFHGELDWSAIRSLGTCDGSCFEKVAQEVVAVLRDDGTVSNLLVVNYDKKLDAWPEVDHQLLQQLVCLRELIYGG
jgi:hypothetical protein